MRACTSRSSELAQKFANMTEVQDQVSRLLRSDARTVLKSVRWNTSVLDDRDYQGTSALHDPLTFMTAAIDWLAAGKGGYVPLARARVEMDSNGAVTILLRGGLRGAGAAARVPHHLGRAAAI